MGDWLIGAAAIVVALTTLAVFGSKAWRGARRVLRRASRALDVVLGTPEVPDPDRPGEVLREAVPDIGQRVTKVEDALLHYVGQAANAAERSAAASERAAASALRASVDARSALEAVRNLTAASSTEEQSS